MGFLANSLRKNTTVAQAVQQGQTHWRDVFGTHKEAGRPQGSKPPVPGGSYGRSINSSDASTKRLIQALRSMAPGGWSDDRWEETKRFVGIAYIAIHRICTQLQQAEFNVFVKDDKHPDGKRVVTPDTPAHGNRLVKPYDLVTLLEKPNPQDSFGKMLYRIGQQKFLTGTALNFMVPNKLGVPMEMYTIPTAIAIPQPAINPDFPDGYYRIQPVYPYGPFSSYPTPTTAVGAPIPAQWMLRIQYPHPLLRYDGYSPLTGLHFHLDEVEAMDRSRFYKMKRTFNPSAVLNFQNAEGAQPLTEEELDRIRAEFEGSQGSENVGQLFVAPPGGSLDEFGTKPVEMDYTSSWDQLTSFCMGGLGITKPAAGMVEDSSYSTLFATIKQLNLLTLDPEVNDIASEFTRHLAPFFGDDLIVEIRCRRIDDHDVKYTRIDKAMQAKAITKNEVRKELDMPLTEAAWGDEIAGFEAPPPPPGAEAGAGDPMAALMGGGGGPGAGQLATALGGMDGMATPTGGAAVQENARTEPLAVTQNRPVAGNLSRGAFGPRKDLYSAIRNGLVKRKKSLHTNGEVTRNGSH